MEHNLDCVRGRPCLISNINTDQTVTRICCFFCPRNETAAGLCPFFCHVPGEKSLFEPRKKACSSMLEKAFDDVV